jgi:thiol-disulfide isomerase/thioredoxin
MLKTICFTFCLLLFSTTIIANDGFILSSMEETQKLSKLTNKPALVIFGADYCKFCQILKQDILTNQLSPSINEYIICYIDVKDNLNLKNKYKISSIPDSRIFIDNEQVSKTTGYSKDTYKKWLNNDR